MDDVDDLIRITRKGAGFPIAGLLLMVGSSIAVWSLPRNAALIAVFASTGLIFPVGYQIGKYLGSTLRTEPGTYSTVGFVLNLVQFAYWPIILLLYFTDSRYVPFAMAVLFGSHFIPYGAYYRSPGYYFLGISMPVVASALAIAGPEYSYKYTFASAAPLYAVAAAMILRELKDFPHERRSPNKPKQPTAISTGLKDSRHS